MNSVTNTPEGLELMRTRVFDTTASGQRGDRSDVQNVAITITDGASNVDEHLTVPYADQVQCINNIYVLKVVEGFPQT